MQKTIRLLPVLMALAILVGACLPQQPAALSTQSPGDAAAQIATSVAQTVQAQEHIGTFVAQTVNAQNTGTAAAQASFTATLVTIPTLTPGGVTATPFVVVPSGSGSSGSGGTSSRAQYACTWREVYPRTNIIRAGESFDVVWVITNTGTKGWPAGKDLDYVNGPILSPFLGQELPAMKPGDSVTISFVALAPTEKGLYGMQFKVEGGLCWPALNIQVGRQDP